MVRLISRMRSSPANASLSCVPIDASWITGMVIIAVADTGTGIPADLLPRVFDLFADWSSEAV